MYNDSPSALHPTGALCRNKELLFCGVIPFPECEHVVLRVLADDEVAHLGNCRLGQANLAAEFLHFRRRFIYRRHADVVRYALVLRLLALQESAIGCIVTAAGVDMPVLHRTRKLLDLPTEQRALKRLRSFDIVCRDFKPYNARHVGLSFAVALQCGFVRSYFAKGSQLGRTSFRWKRHRFQRFTGPRSVLAANVSITCRASARSSDLENAIAPDFKSFPSAVRLNWKTYSANSSTLP
jgi:hypothetical protein